LIAAPGDSLRALMMYLEEISPQDIKKINILTGYLENIPLTLN
jgi:bisphosphoglycerate-dependent phosphoglycerate mutase